LSELPTVLLCTQDPDLAQRARGYLHAIADVRGVESLEQADRVLQQGGSQVLTVDLRGIGQQDRLARSLRKWPESVIIALGRPRSEPLIEAQRLGLYATEDVACDMLRFQAVVRSALGHLDILRENRMLREQAVAAPRQVQILDAGQASRGERMDSPLPLRHFSRAFRHFENVDVMLERIVEGVAAATMVTRVGIFSVVRNAGAYKLRAELRCLDETKRLEFRDDDPFVRWLEKNAHLVSRANLDHVRNTQERQLLLQTLDRFGAEVVVPLHARGRIIGWLFVGHRATGLPFGYGDLEDLTVAADHISTTLENALLYEEVAIQKSLAETLLHSLPTGIVAVDEQGIVRWFSTAAQLILVMKPEQVVGQPVEVLGSRLADALRSALQGDVAEFPQAWTDPLTRRAISLQSRQLGGERECLGAVAMIQDITQQRALQEKQEQLERAQFWNELAASMSHEIRNPLVAIKTFAQLLPDRYNDTEFRAEFSKLVSMEVDRLNSIIDQINEFAHPPRLQFQPVDIRRPLKKSLESALPATERGRIRIAASVEDAIPQVWADEKALTDCFAHLIRNSVESISQRKDAEIVVEAGRLSQDDDAGVVVTIRDNGVGIPQPLLDKVFSPFCTTKARGMGLGLPIVKRTVIDHNGRVQIDSNQKGTSVTIMLPTAEKKEEVEKDGVMG
jgi:nitrogen-specific signal transduction histidine kinase/GAF domain-containing protein